MLHFDSITLRRGPRALLEKTSAKIQDGQRVALIGANGAGKSSLFGLILSELSLDEGDLHLSGKCRIAHMAQEVSASDRSALDYVMDGHLPFRQTQAALADAEARKDDQAAAHCHGELEGMEAYKIPVTAEKLLHGLGFHQNELTQPVASFSGGWRIRLNLAQALMCPSDLLLLDEPTNHLDLDAMLWLERWLANYAGTLIFISHDRDFIDSVASHVLHIEHAALHQYTGGYSRFEVQRAQKLALQQAQYEKQQQRIEEITRFVTRFKAKATKAKQAQSRLKALERMEQIAPAHIDSPFKFQFLVSDKVSSPLLNFSKCALGYDAESPIINELSCSILPGTRIGLLGPNGAGKSTLVKSLMGDLSLLGGERTCGELLQIGYFAQHQLEVLDSEASPLLHLQRLNPAATEQSLRDFLGGFDFRGDKALEVIETFSGGEKARLALAMIAYQKPNLLLLDEPTNHLDLEMRHALTVALQAFEGAVIIVSHDRHLLKNTVDEFWLVANGEADVFKGDLDDYQRWLSDYQKANLGSENKAHDTETSGAQSQESVTMTAQEKKEQKRRAAEQRARISPIKKKLEKTESGMQKLQLELQALEETLGDSELYTAEKKQVLKELLESQTDKRQRLEALELEWFDLTEQIEMLEGLDNS